MNYVLITISSLIIFSIAFAVIAGVIPKIERWRCVPILSLIAGIVGYFSIALPFNLFGILEPKTNSTYNFYKTEVEIVVDKDGLITQTEKHWVS